MGTPNSAEGFYKIKDEVVSKVKILQFNSDT